jgi:hypothetical protein
VGPAGSVLKSLQGRAAQALTANSFTGKTGASVTFSRINRAQQRLQRQPLGTNPEALPQLREEWSVRPEGTESNHETKRSGRSKTAGGDRNRVALGVRTSNGPGAGWGKAVI